MNAKTDIECLEEFIHDNSQLERLESLVDEFNIFTSLKIVDTEIRHSNFLAWLLDPSETHGLGSYFLKSFLKRVAYKAAKFDLSCPTVFEVDSWDLDQAIVTREWRNIDILIVDQVNGIVSVIENKIASSEHSDQLQRYKEIVTTEFPKMKKVFVYLSVEGDIPTDSSYLPLSYSDVIPLIDHLLSTKETKASREMLTFISHYREMVKRYIMKDSELQDICQTIYTEHRRALDLIFEYRPDRLSTVHDILIDLINNDSAFALDDSIKMEIRFIPKSLDFLPRDGSWTSSKRILLFDFQNHPEGLDLSLYLGPGKPDLRKTIYDAAQGNLTAFNKAKRKFTDVWFCLFKKRFLTKDQVDDLSNDELRSMIKEKLDSFKQLDLPMLENQITKLK